MAEKRDPDGSLSLTLTKAPRRKLAETVGAQLAEAVRDMPAGTRVPSE
ncbi:MAG: hypothetical protein JSS97_21445, partial [Actinobacteria bacterium]|nr:hypothetical protein [Actinomycetota bacterium]